MFPNVWHFPNWILFLHCVWLRRWLPSQWQASRDFEAKQIEAKEEDGRPWNPPWTVWQFWGMLVTHAAFYLVEVDVTDIISKYPPMASHHLLGVILMWVYSTNVNCLSVLSLFPFVLHSAYFSLGATKDYILASYNIAILLCGLFGMIISKDDSHNPLEENESNGAVIAPPISLLLPVMALAVGSNNYYTFCQYYYEGDACPSRDQKLKTIGGCFFCSDKKYVAGCTETRYLFEWARYPMLWGGGRVSALTACLARMKRKRRVIELYYSIPFRMDTRNITKFPHTCQDGVRSPRREPPFWRHFLVCRPVTCNSAGQVESL
ncbi:hypothetical protein BCR33DRAFT_712931 [Rhizoclosmatium globosum]|uniref:TLC domain-containing protein n=1 Tax=Rhizoclosmatium globosum TaxID=329046 RepID=A0A1Y2CVD5_9FUNG|nr:hypothetical protein BCR33DRAFT_712931 [Rhizoclosmatium globosum]|eukprot:ORY50982.1 hypothetical protein BCR33DRAFT_712931 [Rhizoclosmatium globosum]